MTTHAWVLHSTAEPHLVILKDALDRVVQIPDTYYRELFYPFSPISQMFYYLETGEL